MTEWTRFKDKLPEEGQAIKVRNQWPFEVHGFFRKHKLGIATKESGYAIEELRSQARIHFHEFKSNALWKPITLPEAAKP